MTFARQIVLRRLCSPLHEGWAYRLQRPHDSATRLSHRRHHVQWRTVSLGVPYLRMHLHMYMLTHTQ